jgi:hypothetical protein
VPDPNVGDLLLAKIDELVASAANLLEEIRAATEQLHPERARSCRNAITMASVMVDESGCGVVSPPGGVPRRRRPRRLPAWWP